MPHLEGHIPVPGVWNYKFLLLSFPFVIVNAQLSILRVTSHKEGDTSRSVKETFDIRSGLAEHFPFSSNVVACMPN